MERTRSSSGVLWSPLDPGRSRRMAEIGDTAAILAAIASYGYLYVPLGKDLAHEA